MVSDQHRRVLYPTLFDIRAGVFYVLGDDSPNTQDQRLYVVSEPRIHSILIYKFLVTDLKSTKNSCKDVDLHSLLT